MFGCTIDGLSLRSISNHDASMSVSFLLDWTAALAERCVAPPFGPDAWVVMAGDGPTEQLVSLRVFAPKRLSRLDGETRALLRQFLPGVGRRRLWRPGMVRAAAELAWRHGQSGEAALERYAGASLAAGRTLEATERRLRVIRSYAEAASAGEQFPPILLLYDGDRLIQLDGARRIIAHLLAGRTEIQARLVVERPLR